MRVVITLHAEPGDRDVRRPSRPLTPAVPHLVPIGTTNYLGPRMSDDDVAIGSHGDCRFESNDVRVDGDGRGLLNPPGVWIRRMRSQTKREITDVSGEPHPLLVTGTDVQRVTHLERTHRRAIRQKDRGSDLFPFLRRGIRCLENPQPLLGIQNHVHVVIAVDERPDVLERLGNMDVDSVRDCHLRTHWPNGSHDDVRAVRIVDYPRRLRRGKTAAGRY